MSLPIYNTPTIHCDDIEKHFGFAWSRMIDAWGVEKGSYVKLECNDADLETLYMDIDWFKNKFEDAKVEFTNNQIKVVEYLRSLGHRSTVLMYVDY